MVERLHVLMLASIILSIFLAASVTADSWCYVPSEGDYSCYNLSTYTPGTPGTFNLCTGTGMSGFTDCCVSKFHGQVVTSSLPPPQCQFGCCCNPSTQVPYVQGLISHAFCDAQYNASGYAFELIPAASDCTTVCGTSPGSTGQSFSVSGHVYDVQNASNPQPLDSAMIEYPVGASLMTLFTDATGAYNLGNIPAGFLTFKASKLGCGANVTNIDITSTTTLNFDLNCATGNCVAIAVNDTTATPVKGEPQVRVNWTLVTCNNIQGYNVYRCEGTATSCTGDILVGYAGPDTSSIVDSSVPAGQGFCYKVKVINATGGELNQQLPQSTRIDCPLYPSDEPILHLKPPRCLFLL